MMHVSREIRGKCYITSVICLTCMGELRLDSISCVFLCFPLCVFLFTLQYINALS